MSFKDPCKTALNGLDMPVAVKEIMSDFLDDMDGLYKETGSVAGFKSKAQQFANERILEIASVRNEVIGDIFKSKNNRRILSDGIKERVEAGQDPDAAAAEAFKALISDTTDVTTGGKFSYEARQKSYAASLINELNKLDKVDTGSSKVSGKEVLMNGDQDLNIINEMFDFGGSSKTGNKVAHGIAKVLNGFNELELKMKQAAGVSVGKAKAFVTNLAYDPDRLRAVTKDVFVEKMLKRIDLDESFKGSKGEIENQLGGMYEAIKAGRDTSYLENFDDALKNTIDPRLSQHKRLSNKYNKKRKLVFKSGEDMHAVMKEFGTNTLGESFIKRAGNSSRASALIATFGTNPELAYKNLKNALLREYPGADKHLDGTFSRVDDLFQAAKGVRMSDSLTNKFTNGVLAFQVMTKMGSAVLSAAADLPMAIGTIRSRTGQSYASSTRQLFKEFSDTFTSSRSREDFAEAVQIFMESELGEYHSMLTGAAGGNAVKMGRMASKFLDATLFSRQIFSARHAVGMVMARYTAKAVKSGLDGADAGFTKQLEGFGFNKSTMGLLRLGLEKIDTPTGGKREIVSVRALEKGLAQLEDVSGFKDSVGFKGSDANFKKDVVDRYRAFLNETAMIGSPTPSIRDQAVLKGGVNPNSAFGAALRVMTLFKSFTAAMPRKVAHIVKGRPETMNQPFSKVIKTKEGLSSTAQLVAGLTGMSMLMQIPRDALVGKSIDPEEFQENPELMAKWVGKAMLNSGVTGLYGALLSSMLDRGIAQGGANFVLGPSFSTVKDVGGAVGGVWSNLEKAVSGDQDVSESAKKSASKVLTLGAKQIPNVWYGGAALKYKIIDEIQNGLDPDAQQRRESLMNRFDEEAGRKRIFGE
jgi:hypothetical protein